MTIDEQQKAIWERTRRGPVRFVPRMTDTDYLQAIHRDLRWIRRTIALVLWSYFAVYLLTDGGPAFLKLIGVE